MLSKYPCSSVRLKTHYFQEITNPSIPAHCKVCLLGWLKQLDIHEILPLNVKYQERYVRLHFAPELLMLDSEAPLALCTFWMTSPSLAVVPSYMGTWMPLLPPPSLSTISIYDVDVGLGPHTSENLLSSRSSLLFLFISRVLITCQHLGVFQSLDTTTIICH